MFQIYFSDLQIVLELNLYSNEFTAIVVLCISFETLFRFSGLAVSGHPVQFLEFSKN